MIYLFLCKMCSTYCQQLAKLLPQVKRKKKKSLDLQMFLLIFQKCNAHMLEWQHLIVLGRKLHKTM